MAIVSSADRHPIAGPWRRLRRRQRRPDILQVADRGFSLGWGLDQTDLRQTGNSRKLVR
jgi:hypothetical protein